MLDGVLKVNKVDLTRKAREAVIFSASLDQILKNWRWSFLLLQHEEIELYSRCSLSFKYDDLGIVHVPWSWPKRRNVTFGFSQHFFDESNSNWDLFPILRLISKLEKPRLNQNRLSIFLNILKSFFAKKCQNIVIFWVNKIQNCNFTKSISTDVNI